MLKAKNLSETSGIQPIMLRAYIAKKMTALMEEYHVNDLHDIGCFVVLEHSEMQLFSVAEMEYLEVLEISGMHYLHGVRVLGDSYGEELFLPVEEMTI